MATALTNESAARTNGNGAENETPKKKNRTFLVILIVLVGGGTFFGVSKYINGQHHETTDDAQIDADISPVIPRISGYVTDVRVKDNQLVKKGDTLVILDNRSEMIALEQAEAALLIKRPIRLHAITKSHFAADERAGAHDGIHLHANPRVCRCGGF